MVRDQRRLRGLSRCRLGARRVGARRRASGHPTRGLRCVSTSGRACTGRSTRRPATATRSAPRTTRQGDRDLRLCHARRGQIWDGYVPGQPLVDTHQPALLEHRPLLTPTGRCATRCTTTARSCRAGCTSRASPAATATIRTSGKLRAPGNAVCFQCHQAEKFTAAGAHPPSRHSAELELRGLPHAGARPTWSSTAATTTASACRGRT